jgi:hypothetical protein
VPPVSDLAGALLAAFDDADLAALAERLRPWLAPELETPTSECSEWLAPAAAAEYLGVTRKRIYDLTSSRQLEPDGRDGRTPLYLRSTLDHYARARR